MDEMTTEELAQWLESLPGRIPARVFGGTDHVAAYEAAARLRAIGAELDRLREDAERLDWLEKAEMPVFRIDNGSRSDGVSLMPGWVCGSGFGIQSSQRTIRQAIDEARKG